MEEGFFCFSHTNGISLLLEEVYLFLYWLKEGVECVSVVGSSPLGNLSRLQMTCLFSVVLRAVPLTH